MTARRSRSELDPRAAAQPLLRTQRYGRSLHVLAETDSTNDDARERAAEARRDGHVVARRRPARGPRLARAQPGSRPPAPISTSRSSRGPTLPLAALPPLTLAVGLGVADAVDALVPGATARAAQVKWPNDVWLGRQEVRRHPGRDQQRGGPQRARTALPAAVVIGIGLNVNRLEFGPRSCATPPTSLRAALPGAAPLDRGAVLATLLLAVERWVDRFVREGGDAIAAALEPRLALRGERVRCDDVEGVLAGRGARAARCASRRRAGVRDVLAGRISASP